MKRKCDMMFDHAVASKKKLKYSYAKVRRLKRKVQSLRDIVTDLKKQNMISTTCETVLKSSFSGVSLDIMKRIMSKKSKKVRARSIRLNCDRLH